MKFRWIGEGMPDQKAVEEDYRTASRVGKVRLGALAVYLPRLSGAVGLPYGAIVRAYLRQEEANANMCCGRANFDQFFLMLQGPEDRIFRGQIPNKAQGQEALSQIAARNPRVKLGYEKNQQIHG